MKPEQYFFRYAWPCTEVLLEKKKVSQQRFNDLKFAANNNIIPLRNVLEDTYKTAFENLKNIAKAMKKDHWDISVIKRYFDEGEHNNFINSGKGEFGHAPESLKDMCRVHEGVIDSINKGFIRVEYDNERKARMCMNPYKIKLKPGDRVKIHYGYVIEKII
ncbi:hypothetical protein COV19_01525 [Candidatus Woesearchaeota archaeon CG10_big_fil_rev_8_21_14_0_10_44_13]|nr:MAG: hypothetical protein COV19_01525 [Candidatus Woesearchaeota archaeon CG10_big_fil_rev_8_21_14_0_10_44_13]